MFNLFKPKQQVPYTEAEAVYAAGAQQEIGQAIKALLLVAERGCCNPKLPKKIMAIAELLQSEAETNHSVLISFIQQQEQI